MERYGIGIGDTDAKVNKLKGVPPSWREVDPAEEDEPPACFAVDVRTIRSQGGRKTRTKQSGGYTKRGWEGEHRVRVSPVETRIFRDTSASVAVIVVVAVGQLFCRL